MKDIEVGDTVSFFGGRTSFEVTDVDCDGGLVTLLGKLDGEDACFPGDHLVEVTRNER